MASDSTGNVPAVDEQPHAEEMSEVDGDPPVGEPRPEQEPSNDVPPARPPPRLRVKSRKIVQLFIGKERQRMEHTNDSDRFHVRPDRTLLINGAWLDSFCDAADFGAAQIFFTRGHTTMSKLARPRIRFARTAAGVTCLLRLSRNLTEIDVLSGNVPTGRSFGVMRDWMRVASQLEVLPNLTTIRLTAWHLDCAFARLLVDSLRERLTHLKTGNFRIATMLRKRTNPLESVVFSGDFVRRLSIADVLRLKSARIKIRSSSQEQSHRLCILHDCGPFDPNEHLQELHIRVHICAKEDISRALHRLRVVNGHFKLLCHEAYYFRFEGLLDLKIVKCISKKAKLFAASMSKVGFRSDGDELRIVVRDTENWQHVSHEQVFERLNWTREGEILWPEHSKSLPTCSLVHDGIRILIGLNRV